MYYIDIMTLFPDTVGDVLSESILGRAQERDILRIDTHQIRDYTLNKQKQVDDYPYGGGRGAVMQARPAVPVLGTHLRSVSGASPHHLPLTLRQNFHSSGRQAAGLGAGSPDSGVRPL